MTPIHRQMTAAMFLPAAYAGEAIARGTALWARQMNAMLAMGRPTGRPAEHPADHLAAPGGSADDVRGAEAVASTRSDDHSDRFDPMGDEDHDAADRAELRPVGDTLTAVPLARAATQVDYGEDVAQDITALVDQATGRPPRSLEEMMPANDRPAE